MDKITLQLTRSSAEPSMDTIEHINVHYNCARSKLGRMLSTYYVQRFDHPRLGPFRCVEGLLLYVRTGCVDDAFRGLTGSQAKAHYRQQLKAKQLKSYELDFDTEAKVLMSAMYARLTQHPVTETLFVESALPFENYFLWGDDHLPIRPEGAGLLIQTLTQLRSDLQSGIIPADLSRDAYVRLRHPQ